MADNTAVVAEVAQRTDVGMSMVLQLLRVLAVLLCCAMTCIAFMCLVGITWTTLGSASLVLLAMAAPMGASAVRGLHSRWHKALDDALGGAVEEAPCKAWDNSLI
jgi:hypothetical protein